MNIMSLTQQIENNEIVLPAIQRDFVWEEEKIAKLFDSIMRGYPIGIILLWETYNDIDYRSFIRDFQSDSLHTFRDNRSQKRLRIVLDGQQRLQSLFIALYGSIEGKRLYFDILSGRENSDFREDKYYFNFNDTNQIDEWNNEAIEAVQNGQSKEIEYYIEVSELLSMDAREQMVKQQEIKSLFNLNDDDNLRLSLNFSILSTNLSADPNILKVTTIDENKPLGSKSRKSESDVLEAFVRINTQGTPLNRSDLIFSMIKLGWRESAMKLPEFVKDINSDNNFAINNDFVIRCLFAVSDLGTKLNIDLLRKKDNLDRIQANFDRCCSAIKSSLDFIRENCKIASGGLIGGANNIVPLVYYLFITTNHLVPNQEVERVKKAIFILAFTKPFSRYADSRLWRFIRDEIKGKGNQGLFPLEGLIRWVRYWEKIDRYSPALLQGNIPLVLHLVQGLSGHDVKYERNSPNIDHIFPRSTLRLKEKYDETEINHFANFWILGRTKNQNKSNKHPKDFFSDVPDLVIKEALIDRELLDFKRYRKFIEKREIEILKKISDITGLSEDDFDL